MRDLPIVAKMIINIILYIVYLLLASIIFSFIFPLLMQLLGQAVLSANDPIFEKIQIFIAILVLLITLIFRKYFYISLKNIQFIDKIEVQRSYVDEKVSTTHHKYEKSHKEKKHKKHNKSVVDDNEDEDEIKIYVEKEIK